MTRGCILVVDDNPLTLKVVRATLEAGGYVVLEAQDGQSALLASLSIAPPSRPTISLDGLHEDYMHSVVRQLERQVRLNDHLRDQMASVEAERAALAGLARTLRDPATVETALDEVLYRALDLSGLSRAAVYLRDSDGRLVLRAQCGYAGTMAEALAGFFGHADLLDRVMEEGAPREIRAAQECGDCPAGLLEQSGDVALLLAPIVAGEERLGMLALAGGAATVADGWGSFATALASQISQAIALAWTLSRNRENEELLTRIVETISTGLVTLDRDGAITFANAATEKVFGVDSVDEMLGKPLSSLVDEQGRAIVAAHLAQRQQGTLDQHDVKFQHKDGTVVWALLSTNPLFDGEDRYAGALVTVTDITARKQVEERQERQARHAALRADVGVALAESTTSRDMLQRCCAALVRHLDAAFARVWTLDEAAAVLELQASAGLYTHLDGAHARVPVGHLKIGRIAQEGRPHLTNEVLTDPRVGDKEWARREGMVAFAGYPLVSDARVTGVLALFARQPLPEDTLEALAATVEIIVQGLERKRAEEALRHQALHDALTGLPNRVLLQDRVQQAILAAQYHPQPLALLLLDLDRFKEVNDTLGHQHGDLLLKQVAERLRATLRATDTVARLGGDEFAVLLPATDRGGATIAAGKVHMALDTPFAVDGQSLRIGASIGIALCPEHGRDSQVLLRHADVAMYAAKRSAEACATYTPEQDEYTADRLTLLVDLRQAIVQGDLLLHYQPKVHLPTGRVCGVEALVRWQHPQRGLVPPGQFIPLAEQTGLIGPLTHWVLEEALRQCRAWRRAGLQLAVAVNISMANVRDRHLPDTIAQLLTTYDVPPAALRLEVTESNLMADVARAQEVLTRLADLGVDISVDDFGTGYSSLAHLKRLPVDELKIDMSFVRHMAEDATDRAIVASTVALGHSLGLQVVAEGVEDRQTQQMLAAIGCDAAQGYYLSRPLPADAVAHWLREAQPAAA